MSTAAITAVLAKFAGLNVASKAVIGLAVAAGAVGGVPAVAHQFAPDTTSVAVVEPAAAALHHDLTGVRADANSAATDAQARATSTVARTTTDANAAVADAAPAGTATSTIAGTTTDAKAVGAEVKSDVHGAVGAALTTADAARTGVTGAVPDASTIVGQATKSLDDATVAVGASAQGGAQK